MEPLELREAGIDDVFDARYGDGRLGDVGGEDDLARVGTGRREGGFLLVRGETGVERAHDDLFRKSVRDGIVMPLNRTHLIQAGRQVVAVQLQL